MMLVVLKEAARWAPSCFGEQPWRFIFCHRATHLSAWENALSALVEANRRWAKNAPLLVLVCAAKVFLHNGNANRHGQYDTGAAALSMVLEAENQGLRCHQMGGFDARQAQEIFTVPDSFECMAMMAIGKQAAHQRLSDETLQAREIAPRQRKPLAECFFDGVWGAESS